MNNSSKARKVALTVLCLLWFAALVAGGLLIYLSYFCPLPSTGLRPVVFALLESVV